MKPGSSRFGPSSPRRNFARPSIVGDWNSTGSGTALLNCFSIRVSRRTASRLPPTRRSRRAAPRFRRQGSGETIPPTVSIRSPWKAVPGVGAAGSAPGLRERRRVHFGGHVQLLHPEFQVHGQHDDLGRHAAGEDPLKRINPFRRQPVSQRFTGEAGRPPSRPRRLALEAPPGGGRPGRVHDEFGRLGRHRTSLVAKGDVEHGQAAAARLRSLTQLCSLRGSAAPHDASRP